MDSIPDYAELHCLSNFSFQRGASSALELFERAAKLGYRALAITDECSLAGIVRALEASEKTGVALIVGSEIILDDGLKLVLLAENLASYQSLCALITQGRRNVDAGKGKYVLSRADVAEHSRDLLALWIPGADPSANDAKWIKQQFLQNAWLAVELHRGPDDAARLRQLLDFAVKHELPAVAAGDVHMHVRRRRALQDTMTAIRHRTTLRAGSGHLFPNGERHLRSREMLAELYPPALIEETLRIAVRCTFDLKRDLKYKYPHEIVPQGHTPTTWLRHLVEHGVRWRWPEGETAAVRAQIETEIALITELEYEAFFLTVYDIVSFARGKDILCQGRGSAANSAVCFCLGITEVDPARSTLVFGRFLSRERKEPPDIDVDFEHERREEVIQHVYEKYGRERAALAATVISYRTKSALRDVTKALGFSADQVDQLSRSISVHDGSERLAAHLAEAGFDPAAPAVRRAIALARELRGFPRHLSQHVGGFVICDAPLSTLVPVENAAMPDRTIIQWDKDDLDTMGLLKVDCLALGMLTCIRKCLDLLRAHRGRDLTMAKIPKEDKVTYAMIQRADTVGAFQIESRAQMAMLPRLKPKKFYDLVIQVAIVRPGPIQGDMVHPYLQRRKEVEKNPESVKYPSPALEEELKRTLGVPLFQEQVMRIAIVAAGFSEGEADELRRSMAAWKRRGGLDHLRDRLINGMLERDYSLDFANRIFAQMKGFGDYGFPESHATSFAKIAYDSCWLKCHEPAAFACALLNSQPMGFYSASQIVQDLRRHGAKVLPVDVRYSDWNSSLEDDGGRRATAANAQPALRLGLREIRGFNEQTARRIETARAERAFASVVDLCARAQIDQRKQSLLAQAGALRGLAGHRHRAYWEIAGVETNLPLFGHDSPLEADVVLKPPSVGENVLADYASTGLSLGPHPVSLVREQLDAHRCYRSSRLRKIKGTRPVRAAGLVIGRQRPQTASGLTFVTLEDEEGQINVIVRLELAERQRRAFLESRLLLVDGLLESVDGVQHLIAEDLQDLSPLLGELVSRSRDFH
ncbi:MAG: error-prone DNA polymerase [Rudaea sp.]|uniref:error-prone DNA polymerase n=1 Tax=unclassified Rudaea TaxID=2627037 RepID=UPI0010F859D0|nr:MULTISPECIES: error-prone DNA polymerase [unclassified Rudaea]MBN8888427.1 error-prone DNA polymerase [Rudaea sp.]MBR0347538.1 error-prone DNA polymerase [Rudaea sp.]